MENVERQTESNRADLVRADPRALLEVDVSYPGWEHDTAREKAFYVRGFTWFRDRVIDRHFKITACASFIPDMMKALTEKTQWGEMKRFDWDEPFGSRQFIDSASNKKQNTPKFHKAAQIILLCEVIAEDLWQKYPDIPPPEEVFERMRIEPAVSFVHGFDRSVLEKLSPEDRLSLRRWTGQPSNDVFRDMADGYTVTNKLAERTAHYFARNRPDVILGDVDWHHSKQRRYRPSPSERVDVPTRDLPEEAQNAGGAPAGQPQ